MAENYNLNNNNFGLNVAKKGIVPNDIQQTVGNINDSVINLFESMTNYVAKYENVFNGEVEQETNMYIRQSMLVGMSLRAEEGKGSRFDTNI